VRSWRVRLLEYVVPRQVCSPRVTRLLSGPAEIAPGGLGEESVQAIEDVVGALILAGIPEDPGSRVAGADEGGGHPGGGGHADVGIEAVAGHDAVVGGEVEKVEGGGEHVGIGLAKVALALHAGAGFDGGNDGGGVGLAAAAGEGTVTIWVGGDKARSPCVA